MTSQDEPVFAGDDARGPGVDNTRIERELRLREEVMRTQQKTMTYSVFIAIAGITAVLIYTIGGRANDDNTADLRNLKAAAGTLQATVEKLTARVSELEGSEGRIVARLTAVETSTQSLQPTVAGIESQIELSKRDRNDLQRTATEVRRDIHEVGNHISDLTMTLRSHMDDSGNVNTPSLRRELAAKPYYR